VCKAWHQDVIVTRHAGRWRCIRQSMSGFARSTDSRALALGYPLRYNTTLLLCADDTDPLIILKLVYELHPSEGSHAE
jgi:hypothetical protein